MSPEVLAALHAEAFAVPRPWSAAEFAALLSGKGVFLLTEGGAFLLGRALAGEAELLTLAVPFSARRRGLGRRLVAAFETEAVRRGAARAFLEVAAGNGPARALYGGAGWREAGTRRGYYAKPGARPEDALILEKALTPERRQNLP
jgi:ribosomal-protein-alanine N-acetyltransferase